MLAQTILPKEFVCVLDGPIGLNLTEVVKWFKSECSNRNIKIVFVKNPVNCCLGISLAEGLRACSYEYIGRFDSDDLNNPERMEVMLNYMNEDKNQDIAVVGSQIAEFSDSPQRLIGRRKVPISFNEVA
ncbi:glycosyltransferase [Lactiplantibacillus plantarum]|uniref:glycosyltransferase n=1 Tax=Lactiplantibacillus plantarum TaxID=1590 RepID=UPI0009B50AB2|nr:glycosyltransferase [Lactiplantibacillus plantarum]